MFVLCLLDEFHWRCRQEIEIVTCNWQESDQGLCGYCVLTTRPPGHFRDDKVSEVLSEVEFVVMDLSQTQFLSVRADVFRLVLNHQSQLVRSHQADQ